MIKHREYLLFSVEPHSVSIAVAGGTALQYVNSLSRIATVVSLPPGTYQLIGLASELTEEQKKEIVDWYEDSNDSSYDPQYNETTYFEVFTDYVTGDSVDTPDESFDSLLRFHNLKPETTVIIKTII